MKPSQRRSSATLPTSWLTQIALVTPASFICLPPPRPASYSVWPTCTATPSSSRDVGAGVHRDHRDARGDRVADRIAERLGVRDRDHQAVGLRGDRGVDDLRHLHHVEGVGRAVLDRHAEVLGGLVDAVLDHRPERVGGLAVADDDEAHVLGERRAGEAERGRDDGRLWQVCCSRLLAPCGCSCSALRVSAG